MNKYDLFDAIGGVDESLLRRTEQTTKRTPLRKLVIAAAAVMALTVTVAAAPVVREWFFARGSELTQEGTVLEPDENGLGGGYQESSFVVTLVLEDAADAPDTIEDFHIPTYFEEHGWNVLRTTPDELKEYGSWIYFQTKDESVGALFYQQPFCGNSPWDPTREATFSVSGTVDGELIEQSVTIGDMDATLYITPPWSDDDVGSSGGRKKVIWSDGEYAYSLEFDYEAELSFIEEVVLSLESVDINKYPSAEADEGPTVPITTFYSLGMVPEGFALSDRQWLVNNAFENYYLNFYQHISLSQCVNASSENYGPCFSIEGTISDLQLNRCDFTAEVYTVDGVEVTVIRHEDGGPTLMWYLDNYCFSLDFSYDPGLSDEQLLDYYRSVQPMPDYTDHLTE